MKLIKTSAVTTYSILILLHVFTGTVKTTLAAYPGKCTRTYYACTQYTSVWPVNVYTPWTLNGDGMFEIGNPYVLVPAGDPYYFCLFGHYYFEDDENERGFNGWIARHIPNGGCWVTNPGPGTSIGDNHNLFVLKVPEMLQKDECVCLVCNIGSPKCDF